MPVRKSNEAILRDLLYEYVTEFPAFRAKPVGSPESYARTRQESLIKLEDRALKALGLSSKPGP